MDRLEDVGHGVTCTSRLRDLHRLEEVMVLVGGHNIQLVDEIVAAAKDMNVV